MTNKKLSVIIALLLILNLFLISCGKSTEGNTTVETSKTSISTSSNDDKNKEIDEKYVEAIRPYIFNIKRDWDYLSPLCSKDTDMSKNTKEEIVAAFADINKNWEKVFNIKSETTNNIEEIKKVMENIKNLQENSLNISTECLDNLDKEAMKECNKVLNESNEIMKNEFAPLYHKMNNEKIWACKKICVSVTFS